MRTSHCSKTYQLGAVEVANSACFRRFLGKIAGIDADRRQIAPRADGPPSAPFPLRQAAMSRASLLFGRTARADRQPRGFHPARCPRERTAGTALPRAILPHVCPAPARSSLTSCGGGCVAPARPAGSGAMLPHIWHDPIDAASRPAVMATAPGPGGPPVGSGPAGGPVLWWGC
jgi:hypothetical protein